MKYIKGVAKLLMIVGALNWGLVGFFGYDLVADLFGGSREMGARVVYALVGLAGVFGLARFCTCCCMGKSSCCGSGSCGSNCNCGPGCNCKKGK